MQHQLLQTKENNIATFLRHTSCPRCGSRDNLGEYSDGSTFCFGCRYATRGNESAFVTSRRDELNACDADPRVKLTGSSSYPPTVVEWLKRYRVEPIVAIQRGVLYDSTLEQLNFPFYSKEGLVCVQSRNFNSYRAAKAKYYNVGNSQEATSIYKTKSNAFVHRLVITEDALSAMRIASQCDAIPALGTHVPVSKIIALAPFYEFVTVWLDSDKWREARTIAENFQWLGLSANTIFTELDPKEYSDEEITAYLSGKIKLDKI